MRFIIFVFVLLLNNFSIAKTYFVGVNGSDQSSGSFNAPFKTIQFAIDQLLAGDTCIVFGGTYYETLRFKNSGIENLPIVLKNYGSEKVVIKNLTNISNWNLHEKNIYKSKISKSFSQAFLNDAPIMQASFPSISEGTHSTSKWIDAYASVDKKITLSQNFQSNPGEKIQMCGIFGKGLIAIGGIMIEKNNNNLIIDNDSWYWGETYKEDYLSYGKCFLTGSYSFIDTPGEWYCDKDFIYMIPYNNDTNNLAKMEFRSNLYGIDLNDTKNIIIEGISLFGGSISLMNSENIVFQNNEVNYITPFFRFDYGYTVSLDSVKVGTGITVYGNNIKFLNCKINNSWGDAFSVNGESVTIENCLITNCNWMGIDCAPIYIGGKNNSVINNTIKYTGRSSIVHAMKNSKILNNRIENFGLMNDDLGGIYCYGSDGANTEIGYNFITKSKAKNGVGIYIDNHCKNFRIHHNIVSFCNVGIALNKPGGNFEVYHNTLYKNNYSMGSYGGNGEDLYNTYTYNNLTDNDNRANWNYMSYYGSKLDSNLVYQTSIFKDPKNGDFSLKKYSYPIDKGVITSSTVKFNGTSPDMGAIEFGAEASKIGSSLNEENKPNTIPLPPLNLKIVKKDSNKVFLEWEYPYQYIDGFKLYKKLSNDKYILICDNGAVEHSYIDTLKNIGDYRYVVFAYNKFGTSEESNLVDVFHDFFDNYLFVNTENCDIQRGVKLEEEKVLYTDDKDWIGYYNLDFNNFNRIKTRYAVDCMYSGQEVQIRLDKPSGPIISTFNTTSTGSFDSLQIFEYDIDSVKGIHSLYIRFRGRYGIGNFDWLEFFSSSDSIKNPKDLSCIDAVGMQSFYTSLVYPNPILENAVINYYCASTSNIEITIYDRYGTKLDSKNVFELSSGTNEIDIHELKDYSNGLYLINTKIYYNNNVFEEKVHKVIKI